MTAFSPYLNVLLEVPNSAIYSCVSEVVVNPADEDLFRGQLLQVLGGLPILQEIDQTGMVGQVDVTQQPNL